MKRVILFVGLAVAAVSCAPKDEFVSLNAQAQAESLVPVRPGCADGSAPYWNVKAYKFTYAPSFDFPSVEGAQEYRYSVDVEKPSQTFEQWSRGEKPKPQYLSFIAKTPNESLAQIWDKVPQGEVSVAVEAFDSQGLFMGVVGERKFYRDYVFHGPYPEAKMGYRQAAIKALMYNHTMPAVQSWKEQTVPDMSYSHNTYACKTIGALISNEVTLARLVPAVREDAIQIARNAAQFLIDQSRPEGDPLAFFPPTYYLDLVASKRAENQNKTMMLEAERVAGAFLDLFSVTGDSLYIRHANGIADTYLRCQAEDGSLPIKVDFITGEKVNEQGAMLGSYIRFCKRMAAECGRQDMLESAAKAEEWMNRNVVSSWNWTGQFEDVSVLNLATYENLTNCTSAPYARMLMEKTSPSAEDIALAKDLIHFAEDQFVYWDWAVAEDGSKRINTPAVFEQYKYRTPVDNSACNVANALLSYYEVTGDELSYAKAKALIDNIVNMQDMNTGQIPTTWDCRKPKKGRSYWINCSFASVEILLRFDEIQKNRR